MKNIWVLLLFVLVACEDTNVSNNNAIQEDQSQLFDIDINPESALTLKALRIFPILASEEMVDANASFSNLTTLEKAITLKGFHITEKKKFGPEQEMGVIDQLTVQNKTKDSIYIMSGDIVTGGKQDRVIAQDMILPPRTLKQISVFCVEKGRWEFRNPDNDQKPISKKQYAFKGYYQVVSNDVRQIIFKEKDQEAIWEVVRNITDRHDAVSHTEAYTQLEQSDTFTMERNQYLNFFYDSLTNKKNIIGILAVNGEHVLGADIFAHPNLFHKKLKSLLYAHITQALGQESTNELPQDELERYVRRLDVAYKLKGGNNKINKTNRFDFNGKIVHFSSL